MGFITNINHIGGMRMTEEINQEGDTIIRCDECGRGCGINGYGEWFEPNTDEYEHICESCYYKPSPKQLAKEKEEREKRKKEDREFIKRRLKEQG